MVGLRDNAEIPSERMTDAAYAQMRALRDAAGLGHLGHKRRGGLPPQEETDHDAGH